MSSAAESLRRGVQRVVVVQALLTLCVAAAFFSIRGWHDAVSAAYGGGIAACGAWWLGWRLRRTGGLSVQHRKWGVAVLYLGFLERFGLALVGFALGVGTFKLPAVPQVLAFTLAQFSYIAAARRGPFR